MERNAAVARLVGQVERIVRESGDPERAFGFDAVAWVTRFLASPIAALGERCPEELMGTAEGLQQVALLVAPMQSGAYS